VLSSIPCDDSSSLAMIVRPYPNTLRTVPLELCRQECQQGDENW
jgi:hypothetical protein